MFFKCFYKKGVPIAYLLKPRCTPILLLTMYKTRQKRVGVSMEYLRISRHSYPAFNDVLDEFMTQNQVSLSNAFTISLYCILAVAYCLS